MFPEQLIAIKKLRRRKKILDIAPNPIVCRDK